MIRERPRVLVQLLVVSRSFACAGELLRWKAGVLQRVILGGQMVNGG